MAPSDSFRGADVGKSHHVEVGHDNAGLGIIWADRGMRSIDWLGGSCLRWDE